MLKLPPKFIRIQNLFFYSNPIQNMSELTSKEHSSILKFFDDDFQEHKNNMLVVSQKFDSLSLKEKLLVKAHLIEGLNEGRELYRNSKAVKWLLNSKNISELVSESLVNIEMFEIKEISELMTLIELENEDDGVPLVIDHIRFLSQKLNASQDLDFLFKALSTIQNLQSFKWNTIEKILPLNELKILEKTSRAFRNPTQEVLLFTCLKELNLEELSSLEVKLLNNIIENIQVVDPALYLKLTLNLLSHFLIDFSRLKHNGKSVQALIAHQEITLSELKSRIPALELLEQISEREYDPNLFSSDQLISILPVIPALTSISNVFFYNLFPLLGERISLLACINFKKNCGNRNVIDQLFHITKIPQSLSRDHAQILLRGFSNNLMNYAVMYQEMGQKVQDPKLIPRSEEIFESFQSFQKKIKFEFRPNKIPILDLISSQRYSDVLKLSMFFESCFFFVFPIYFYCLEYQRSNPKDQIIDPFMDFSFDLLMLCCQIGFNLIHMIKEFDYDKSLDDLNEEYEDDKVKLNKMLIKLEHQKENNKMVYKMISGNLKSKRQYFLALMKSESSKPLMKKIRKLDEMINTTFK